MCGINGIYVYQHAPNPVACQELVRTRDHMTARGPDGKGDWISEDKRVGLGHRRLSIIDLTEAAAQPMASADGKLVVTFNGEIYNYRQLRRRLEAKGCVFRSQSDTEVLLHLYFDKGDAMVQDLRGMFAFAIWDAERQRLFLARDPYGIKPLYYNDDGKTIRFASQVKALLAGGQVSQDADPAGWVGFHLFGSVPEPFTIYSEIQILPAGTTLIVSRNGVRDPHRYHSIAATYAEGERRLECIGRKDERRAAVASALLDSVANHLVADVPVGAFLSAGIDSGALVGLMRDAGQRQIKTVTLTFGEFRGADVDEAPLAADVARAYGTIHTTRTVTEDEFFSDLPLILNAMDQPSIDGINTWFVSKAARELGLKVAISGVGGDELFGGYPSFRQIPKWVRWLAAPARIPHIGSWLRGLAFGACGRRLGRATKAVGMLEYGGSYAGAYLLRRGLFMPWELSRVMEPELAHEGLQRLDPMCVIQLALRGGACSAFAKVATLEACLYMRNQLLRDTDWASMAHSLEVRTPLADATLLEQVARFGDPRDSAIPKMLLATAPSRPLPNTVIRRRKTGFGLPTATWMGGSAFGHSRDWARQLAGRTGDSIPSRQSPPLA